MSLTRKHLNDLLSEVQRIERFTEEGQAAFLQDARTQYAVMMAYARIGEIAKRVPDAVLNQSPEAEWRSIKGFRDVLIHRYDEILPERVWDAVAKLPTLKAAIVSLLTSLPDEGDA